MEGPGRNEEAVGTIAGMTIEEDKERGSPYAELARAIRAELDARRFSPRAARIVRAVLRASLERGHQKAVFPSREDLRLVTGMSKGNLSQTLDWLTGRDVLEIVSEQRGVYALRVPPYQRVPVAVPETTQVSEVWSRVLCLHADDGELLKAEPVLSDALRESFTTPSPVAALATAMENRRPGLPETPLERFSRRWPAVPGSGTGRAAVVPGSGTDAGSHFGNRPPVPTSGTMPKAPPNASFGAVPESGAPRVRACAPQALASSDLNEVQKLARAETTQRAIDRLAALSPAEWQRYEANWRPVAESRPKRLLELLDELAAEIERRESLPDTNPQGKPIRKPLAWLYRKAEDEGLVRQVRHLRTL